MAQMYVSFKVVGDGPRHAVVEMLRQQEEIEAEGVGLRHWRIKVGSFREGAEVVSRVVSVLKDHLTEIGVRV